MAWRYFNGQYDDLSGCELEINDFTIYVHPLRPPHGFEYIVTIYQRSVTRGQADTRELAKQEALEKLNGWLNVQLVDLTAAAAQTQDITEEE